MEKNKFKEINHNNKKVLRKAKDFIEKYNEANKLLKSLDDGKYEAFKSAWKLKDKIPELKEKVIEKLMALAGSEEKYERIFVEKLAKELGEELFIWNEDELFTWEGNNVNQIIGIIVKH